MRYGVRSLGSISSESDSEDHSKRDLKSATDSLTQSILKQLQKHAPQTNESQIKNNSNDVIVVDTSDPKKRKTDFKNKKNIKLKQVSNPLEKLLKSKNAHETATWDGIAVDEERKEMTKHKIYPNNNLSNSLNFATIKLSIISINKTGVNIGTFSVLFDIVTLK